MYPVQWPVIWSGLWKEIFGEGFVVVDRREKGSRGSKVMVARV